MAGNYAITVMAHEVAQMPAEGEEFDWLRDHYAHQLAVQIRELGKQFHQIAKDDPRDPTLERLHKQLEAAERKMQNVEKLLADDPDEWVFDLQPDRLNILPLWGARLAQRAIAADRRQTNLSERDATGRGIAMQLPRYQPGQGRFLKSGFAVPAAKQTDSRLPVSPLGLEKS